MSAFILEEVGRPAMYVGGLTRHSAEMLFKGSSAEHPTEVIVPVPEGLSPQATVELMKQAEVEINVVAEQTETAA